jgi:hypothetical protein
LNPEILRLLNPKSVRLDGASRGVPAITIDDINAACAGADQIGLDLLLSRVCDDRSAQHRAFYSLHQEVVQLAVDHHWKIREKGQEKLRSLTQLILFELTNPVRCPKCKGTRYNKQLRPCKTCYGTGFYKIKNAQRARALGVNASTWGRIWGARYADVLSLLLNHESDALKNISKKLKRDLS